MVAFNGWAEMDDSDSVTVAGHHQKFQIWGTDTSVMYGACPSAPLPLPQQFHDLQPHFIYRALIAPILALE